MSKKLLDFYTSYIANWISGGELINRVNLSSLGIKPLFILRYLFLSIKGI